MAKDPMDSPGKGSAGGVTKHQALATGKMNGTSMQGLQGSAGRPSGSATKPQSSKHPYTGKNC